MTAIDPEPGERVLFLRVELVRKAIALLAGRKVHEYFPGYLQLHRQAAAQGSDDHIDPNWVDLEPFLAVPGGPQPNFRPFASRGHNYWLNGNLPGSYAGSSVRLDKPGGKVVSDDGNRHSLTLRSGHAELALAHLLYSDKLAVRALAIFLYRNHGFSPEVEEQPLAPVIAFRRDFGFEVSQGAEDFDVLFTLDPMKEDRDLFVAYEGLSQ